MQIILLLMAGVLLGLLSALWLMLAPLKRRFARTGRDTEAARSAEAAALAQLRQIQARQVETRLSRDTFARRVSNLEELVLGTAGAAHDLKNLLDIIAQRLDSAMPQSSDSLQRKIQLRGMEQVLEEAGRACARLMRPIAYGKGRLESLYLNDVLRGAQPVMEGCLDLGMRLKLELEDSLPSLKFDRELLLHALLELVLAARKSMLPDGELSLSTRLGVADVLLTLQNHAQGMPEPDSRVYETVRQCGGRLELFNLPGQGSTFVVSFSV